MIYTEDSIVFETKPIHPRFRNLQNQVFNRLQILGYAGKRGHNVYWFCKCICGNITRVSSFNLLNGDTQSCGCLAREMRGNLSRTHGESRITTPEYRAYMAARSRCNNPNMAKFPRYGGRGIEFRFTSYEEFLNEVGRRPTPKFTINRIDNNGHYEKGNLEWTVAAKQMRNMSRNHMITINGFTQCITDWAAYTGINLRTIYSRLRYKWCIPCAVTLSVGNLCPHKT